MASPLSQPFAGVGVADRKRKEAEAERQHKDIKHGIAPVHQVRAAEERQVRRVSCAQVTSSA